MEQRDENSGNKPPSSQNPSEIPSNTANNEPEIVNRQGLPDSETITVNHSGNPIIKPETQSSSPSNNQNLDPSWPTPPPPPPPPPKIPGGDDVSNPKSTSVPGSPSNSSDDDFPTSSMPYLGPEIQNPPLQVMERAEEPGTPSAYRIPSRVFHRTITGTPEWSIASNESLFSIHMGNMSFSRELEWLNETNMSGDPLPPLTSDINNGGNTKNQRQNNKPNDPSTSNQIQANNLYDTSKGYQSQVNKPNDDITTGDRSQANKFNDMSQNVGKFHQDYDEMTEAKAAETMRQVILENSKDYDLSCASVASRLDGSNHNNANDVSRHSDCSAKSFAFNLRPEGGKSQRSPRGFHQAKPKQKMKTQTQTETGTPKEISKPSTQATKPCPNAPFKWLCCFTCCIR